MGLLGIVFVFTVSLATFASSNRGHYSETQMAEFHEAIDQIGAQGPQGVFSSSWLDPRVGVIKVTLNKWDDATVAKMEAVVPKDAFEITVDPTVGFESLEGN
jgi:hypothetical protein